MGSSFSRLYFDRTEPLPDGIGRWPPPYPGHGLELSSGVAGHLVLQIRPGGDDAWQKDDVHVHVREIRRVADGFDSWTWVEDAHWTDLGHFPRDAWISTDADEGFTRYNLRF